MNSPSPGTVSSGSVVDFSELEVVPETSTPVLIDKEVVTEEPPEFIPNPPTPALTGAGGRMLVNIGSYSYQVRRDAAFYDNLVKFNSSTYEVINVSQSFGACDPVYAESGRFLGCANTDHSIHSICTDGTYLYLSAHKDLRKYDSSLNIVKNVTSSVTYDQLCYASSFLWAVSGTTVYKLSPTTLVEVSNFTISSIVGDLILNTDGTDLLILRSVTGSYELVKHTVGSSTSSILATGLSRRTPIVVGNYVYVGNVKIHKSTGASTALSFDLDNTPYQVYRSHWSTYGTMIAVLKYADTTNYKQEILIVDTADDSVVSTITNFQEVITCGSQLYYAPCQGIGLISTTKLIVSNGLTACYNYWGELGYAGYSVYELN